MGCSVALALRVGLRLIFPAFINERIFKKREPRCDELLSLESDASTDAIDESPA
jgi:hypothetical protein